MASTAGSGTVPVPRQTKTAMLPGPGALMAGRVDCRWKGRDITLMRATRRQGTPMGEFKALYAGTGDVVPDLTGQNCGETLLGVTREVYERSAFIRQSAWPSPGMRSWNGVSPRC